MAYQNAHWTGARFKARSQVDSERMKHMRIHVSGDEGKRGQRTMVPASSKAYGQV